MPAPHLPMNIPGAELVLYGGDDFLPTTPRRGINRLLWWKKVRAQRFVDRVAWADSDSMDVDQSELGGFRIELRDLDHSSWGEDEWEFESPTLLRREIGLSDSSLETFRRLVRHRRSVAATVEGLCLPSQRSSDEPNPGFTIVHLATGIMASFYVQKSGFGRILAKSYSNPFKPAEIKDQIPRHFYGYGIGRRIYLAAHALWPKIRWEDGASRATSKSLRKALHRQNPFVWEDKLCVDCPNNATSWRSARNEDFKHAHP